MVLRFLLLQRRRQRALDARADETDEDLGHDRSLEVRQ
jgi:hypothetical protein